MTRLRLASDVGSDKYVDVHSFLAPFLKHRQLFRLLLQIAPYTR